MVYKFIKYVFPMVDEELEKWTKAAREIPCRELKKQALASIKHKKFHCQGGSIYALYPGVCTKNILRFIVAFQTISDYLDNLCDRAGCEDESAFRRLHRAYMDAVNPFENKETEGLSPNINTNTNSSKSSFYYELYPFKEDGGYLHRLVSECRSSLLELPHYNRVQEEVTKLAQLYCDLQTYKHIALDKREKALMEWAQRCDCKRFGISTWEFAAASGSTLGIFMLCALASGKTKPGTEQVSNIVNAYFPWICGFHILLDYFIDQMEDRENHDLNFTFYYRNRVEEKERLVLFASRALAASRRLPNKNFHCLVVKGLASMYLSDIKAGIDGTTREISREILEISGLKAILMHKLCNFLRVKELL